MEAKTPEKDAPKKGRRVPGMGREDGKSPIKEGMRNEVARERIQTSKIVAELEKHVLNPRSKLSATRIAAAKILLAKTMPDLAASKVEVDVAPVQFSFNIGKKEPATPAQDG